MFLFVFGGILKNVKDHIRECSLCQSRRSVDDGSGPRPLSRQGRRKAGASVIDEDYEEEEEDEGDDSLFATDLSSLQRSKFAKGAMKHEVVFVSSRPDQGGADGVKEPWRGGLKALLCADSRWTVRVR